MEIPTIIVNIDADLKELIPQFLENRRRDIENLEQLFQQNDLVAIAMLAHKIKGTTAGYGFAEQSEIASKIEKAAKNQETAPIQDLILKMKSHFQNIEVRYVE